MGKENKKKAENEENKAEKTEDLKKDETKSSSSPLLVLSIQLHCIGCTKKIERIIWKTKGVEGVVTDFEQNQVSIKGAFEPQLMCDRLERKTKRRVEILLPPLPEAKAVVASSQVSELKTMELHVNMHCEACAAQLKKMILKLKGVTNVETDLSSGKAQVTGTLEVNKLVDYVYRCTKKKATVVPQPEPEPVKPKEEEKPSTRADDASEEESPESESGKEEASKSEEEKEEEEEEPLKSKESSKKGGKPEAKEEEEGGKKGGKPEAKDKEEAKAEVVEEEIINGEEDEQNESIIQRRMMYTYSNDQPLYIIQMMPPPQYFSDENPNACCIS